MKHYFKGAALTALLIISGCQKMGRDPEPGNDLFDESIVPALTVTVSQAEWNRLLTAYDSDNHTHEYACCDVRLVRDDKEYKLKSAGLRLKGQTSRRRPEGYEGEKHSANSKRWRHVHFMLNSDVFVEKGSQTLMGYDKIVLKYAHEDPTYVREHYGWDLAQRYGIWTGVRTSYCRLYLDIQGDPAPKYYGVYLMMEGIDKDYLKQREQLFGSDDGFLWKCCGANLRDYDDWRCKVDDNSSDERPYELKTGTTSFYAARLQLKGFIYNLNNLTGTEFEHWIDSVCDVDLLLKTYAMFVAIGHWDDYWNNLNNFYIYFNSKDRNEYRFYMIPYDLDNTLGTCNNCGVQTDAGRQDPYNWGQAQCTLMPKILSVKRFRNRYTEYLKDFTDLNGELFGWKASLERITTWQDMIRPYLDNDTGEDIQIVDRPASWGNHPEYRIMLYCPNNWFKVKTESISYWTAK